MYTSGNQDPRRTAAASSAPPPRPEKGKRRARDEDNLPPLPEVNVSAHQTGFIEERWGDFATLLDTREHMPVKLPRVPERTPLGSLPQPKSFPAKVASKVVQPLRRPMQNPADPSHFRLPPIREQAITAPLQPRVTDMHVAVEHDASRQTPTFTVCASFQISMQPGELPE